MKKNFALKGGGGGGRGGGVRMSASGAKSRAPQVRELSGVWRYSPPGNFEKTGYLIPHSHQQNTFS